MLEYTPKIVQPSTGPSLEASAVLDFVRQNPGKRLARQFPEQDQEIVKILKEELNDPRKLSHADKAAVIITLQYNHDIAAELGKEIGSLFIEIAIRDRSLAPDDRNDLARRAISTLEKLPGGYDSLIAAFREELSDCSKMRSFEEVGDFVHFFGYAENAEIASRLIPEQARLFVHLHGRPYGDGLQQGILTSQLALQISTSNSPDCLIPDDLARDLYKITINRSACISDRVTALKLLSQSVRDISVLDDVEELFQAIATDGLYGIVGPSGTAEAVQVELAEHLVTVLKGRPSLELLAAIGPEQEELGWRDKILMVSLREHLKEAYGYFMELLEGDDLPLAVKAARVLALHATGITPAGREAAAMAIERLLRRPLSTQHFELLGAAHAALEESLPGS